MTRPGAAQVLMAGGVAAGVQADEKTIRTRRSLAEATQENPELLRTVSHARTNTSANRIFAMLGADIVGHR